MCNNATPTDLAGVLSAVRGRTQLTDGTGDGSMSRPCILLVEDDVTISTLVTYALRRAGYEVMAEADGRSGLEAALRCPIDVAIVDIMLPQLDGLAISRTLAQRKPGLPLILLTARSDKGTVLEGFEAGADDYVTKPFDIDELLARVAARLRRVGVLEEGSASAAAPLGPIHGVRVDRNTHTFFSGDRAVSLRPKEFNLLEMLLSNPGHLFTREQIVHGVWHQRYQSTSRTLDVHVRRVRAKLAEAEAPISIVSVRGVGYRVVQG